MRLAVYGAVLAIALGSVLFGLDWVSAPMSPMVDTEAGLRAVAPPPIAATSPPVAPKANIGAPIIPPGLVAPARPNVPPPSSTAAQGTPQVAPLTGPQVSPQVTQQVAPQGAAQITAQEPVAAAEPEVRCNVAACTAAYRSFTASDCTYLPTGGPRKLCTK